ncbi:unnamed protein product [Urochloa humidicola]
MVRARHGSASELFCCECAFFGDVRILASSGVGGERGGAALQGLPAEALRISVRILHLQAEAMQQDVHTHWANAGMPWSELQELDHPASVLSDLIRKL